jgi:hypothetical protein
MSPHLPVVAALLLAVACKHSASTAAIPEPAIDMRGTWQFDQVNVEVDEPCEQTPAHPPLASGSLEIVAHPTQQNRFALASILWPDPLPGCGRTSIEAALNVGDGRNLTFIAPELVGYPECAAGGFLVRIGAASANSLVGTYEHRFGTGGLVFSFVASRHTPR